MGIHNSRKWYLTEDAARRLTEIFGRFVSIEDLWNLVVDQAITLYFRPLYQPVLVLKVIPACAWPMRKGKRGIPAAANQLVLTGEEGPVFKFQTFRVWSIDSFDRQALPGMKPEEIEAEFNILMEGSGVVYSADWEFSVPAGVILEDQDTGDLFQLLKHGERKDKDGNSIQYCHPTTIAWDDPHLLISADDLATVESSNAPRLGDIAASGTTENVPRPVPRHAAQEAAILAEIERQGVQPCDLPKPPSGKAGIKAAIRKAVTEDKGLFQSDKVFELAWERLRKSERIRDRGKANPPPSN